jgi:hypothetical protein
MRTIWGALGLAVVSALPCCFAIALAAEDPDERAAELERVTALCREAQPAVAAISGFPEGEPIAVDLMSRAEIRQYLADLLDEEYPDDELGRRSRCFAEIGLLPRDYDLEKGLLEVLDEQAGGYYDPHRKAFISIADQLESLRADRYQRLIAGHELVHGLQDREYDLVARGLEVIRNLDAGYPFVSVMEGTAMVAGMAYMQGADPVALGDLGPVLRAGYEANNAEMDVLSRSPVYLRERLIGPYVDGATLVYHYLLRNPGTSMGSLFENLPASAEQVLHFEKYLENDRPADVDLSAIDDLLPAEWRPLYSNTLGEFEVRVLFASHPATRGAAADIAAGWDGCRIAAHETGSSLVVVGLTEWDTQSDAVEFRDAFDGILRQLHGDAGFEIRHLGRRLAFATGVDDVGVRDGILERLIGGREPEREALVHPGDGRSASRRTPATGDTR